MAQSDFSSPSPDSAAQRQRQPVAYDLMRPGPGTPWEDRGGKRGTLGAFFATCFMSMRSPMRLFHSIRRPETASDAFPFVIICGVLWGLGWVINGAIYFYYHHNANPQEPLDPHTYFLGSALQLILTPIVVWFIFKLSTGIYYKMASGELASRFPPALVRNVFAYAMGPSLLAVLPFVGPPLALLWILILLMVAGRLRMGLSMSSAIVDAIMSTFGMFALFTIGYFLVRWLWLYLYAGPST